MSNQTNREPSATLIARSEFGIDDALRGHSVCNANGRPKIWSNSKIMMMSDEWTIARRKKDQTEGFSTGPSLSWTIPMVCGAAMQLNRHLPGIFCVLNTRSYIYVRATRFSCLRIHSLPSHVVAVGRWNILIFICISLGTVCSYCIVAVLLNWFLDSAFTWQNFFTDNLRKSAMVFIEWNLTSRM